MKNKALLATFIAATLTLTACSGAGTDASPAKSADPIPTTKASLPADIQSRGKLVAGVACDSPPAGSIDLEGKNVGYEIEFVKRIAQIAFGDENAVQMQCVNGDNRIPFLESGKIDFILATFAWSPSRAAAVDYSEPIWVSNLRLVVPKDSTIESYDDLAGKTVITAAGTSYIQWFEACHPLAKLSLTQSVVDGTTALTQRRGDAFAYIDIYDYNFVQTNPDYKVVGALAAPANQGIGEKKGNAELLTWINEVVAELRQADYFYKTFTSVVTDEEFTSAYRDIVPGPNVNVQYSTAAAPDCKP
jgi:polar amino acid transport system substrate-binding protein